MLRWRISILALVSGFCFGLMAATAPVARSGAEIEAILGGVRLPLGFSISLYARAPGAGAIAVGPKGKVVFIGAGAENRIYALTPGVGRARSVEIVETGLRLDLPHGLCFSPGGTLYVVERNRVFAIPHAEEEWRRPRAIVVVEQGRLIPREEESDGHASRVCRVGRDDKLYISLGQPRGVPPREKLAFYDYFGIGGIVRMDLDGSGREVFARGLRNSAGMDFSPADGALWFTDSPSNETGDDAPSGEINRADRPGLHFGFPWYGGGHARAPEYAGDAPPDDAVFPEVEEPALSADLGMVFYRGAVFPRRFRGGIFSAQHGSGAGKAKVGARLMFTQPGKDGTGGVSERFAEGWSAGAGSDPGGPVDVAEARDGALLVTDDQNGAVYRIGYAAGQIAGK